MQLALGFRPCGSHAVVAGSGGGGGGGGGGVTLDRWWAPALGFSPLFLAATTGAVSPSLSLAALFGEGLCFLPTRENFSNARINNDLQSFVSLLFRERGERGGGVGGREHVEARCKKSETYEVDVYREGK